MKSNVGKVTEIVASVDSYIIYPAGGVHLGVVIRAENLPLCSVRKLPSSRDSMVYKFRDYNERMLDLFAVLNPW
jgi:hypothetical protein